jgi:hypothetical protein
MFPMPCQIPRLRRGTKSEVTKVEIAVRPPPPTPATTRPRMITHCALARPQIKLPRAKKTLENTSPQRREYISVNRPLRGWQAALEIRYEVASHESSENELKDEEMGAESVATIVVSAMKAKVSKFVSPWKSWNTYREQPGRHRARCFRGSRSALWYWVPGVVGYFHWHPHRVNPEEGAFAQTQALCQCHLQT